MSPRVIVLLGPPGSGKTHVGSVLARRLGWTFDDMERWLVERYGSRDAVIANEDEVLAAIEMHYRERVGEVPLVVESTGVSEASMLERFSAEFDVSYVKVWANADRCVERVTSRPAGGNLNNDPEFTRDFHRLWESEVAPRYVFAAEIDNTEDLDYDALVTALSRW